MDELYTSRVQYAGLVEYLKITKMLLVFTEHGES